MILCGIDEAGRGCLCGPVTAASVIIPQNSINIDILADSKALSPTQRSIIAQEIRKHCVWGIGWVFPHEIDTMNIHNASLLAMTRSFESIPFDTLPYSSETEYSIKVDGKFAPNIVMHNNTITMETIIKGDSKIAEIKAASIIAKTARDEYMRLLSNAFPEYLLHIHKGYPTKLHKTTIVHYGINALYRTSFSLPSYKRSK